MLYRLTIVLFAITLSGCPGMSPRDQESFRSHINQTISNDMSFVKTIELLAKDDFSKRRLGVKEETWGQA